MGAAANAHTFPANEKLKGKKVFDLLFSQGKTIKSFPLQLWYLPHDFEDAVSFKVGVVAPKKRFKKAVHRNKVKRLLREAYRQNKSLVFNNIEGSYALLFLYLGNTIPSYSQVDDVMQQLLGDFVKQHLHEKNS